MVAFGEVALILRRRSLSLRLFFFFYLILSLFLTSSPQTSVELKSQKNLFSLNLSGVLVRVTNRADYSADEQVAEF